MMILPVRFPFTLEGGILAFRPGRFGLATSAQQAAPVVLSVSSLEEDHQSLGHILGQQQGRLLQAGSCAEAVGILRQGAVAVVICERDLCDGDWKALLSATQPCQPAPLLIVCSRAADEFLWAEVLNLGGWDVLAKPFDAREVAWSVSLAWKEWLRLSGAAASETSSMAAR